MFCAEGSGLRFDVAACKNGALTARCMGSQAGSTFSTESVVLCRSWLGSVLVKSNANAWSSGVQFRTTTRIELIVRAPSGAAFVNQALAMKLPGLAPSGFNPHAFAHSGLRAPLASGLRLRAVLQDGLPDLPRSPGGSSSSFGSGSPQWPIRRQALPATGFRGISSAR